MSGWLAPNMYECTSCGYVGQLFLEVTPKDYEDFKIQKLKKTKVCPECGKESLKFEKEISKTAAKEMFECKECGYIGTLTSEIIFDDLDDSSVDEEEKA